MSSQLEIRVPDSIVLSTAVSALRAADASGWFGLLPGHEDFITLLSPCLLTYRDESGLEHYAAADGGVLLLEGDKIVIVTREAVAADRLEDVAPVAEAMLRSRREKELTARTEFAELQTSLLRELREVEHGT